MFVFGLSQKILIIFIATSAVLPLATPSIPTPLPRTSKKRKKIHGEEELKDISLKLQCREEGDDRALAPRPNLSPSEDYTEVFLSHARVYVFAEKFDIQPLKRLAVETLDETLSIFTLWPECVGDVVALARFVYSETSNSVHGGERMRSLLKLYIACEINVLIQAVCFRDLLEESRDFLDDFCFIMQLRLSGKWPKV